MHYKDYPKGYKGLKEQYKKVYQSNDKKRTIGTIRPYHKDDA